VVEEHLPLVHPVEWSTQKRADLRATSEAFLSAVQGDFKVAERHRIKPGIGESTRALLRRVPHRLLVADPGAEDLAHLMLLASQKKVPVHHVRSMPYRATAIIREVHGDA